MSDGDYYDRCPSDGCLEVNAGHVSEGHGAGKEAVHDWSIYTADRKAGGCGFNWTRTTRTGQQRYNALGKQPASLTKAAAADATTLVLGGTRDWDERYRLAFGHD